MAGTPCLRFDGSFWRDDEMRQAGTGIKTAARMCHIGMDGADGSIAALAAVEVGRRVFVHVDNTNPVLLEDSPGQAEVSAAGWPVVGAGMEVLLGVAHWQPRERWKGGR